MRMLARAIVLCLASAPALAAAAPVAPPPAEPYEIPKIAEIKIDGDPADWGSAEKPVGFRIEVLGELAPHPAGDTNAAPWVRIGWTEKGLAVLVRVRDNTPSEAPNDASLWEGDSMDLVISDSENSKHFYQLMIAPGVDPAHPKMRTKFDTRGEGMKLDELSAEVASRKTDDGYIVEAILPWSNLGITAKNGTRVGLQVAVNDVCAPGQRIRYRWRATDMAFANPAVHQPLMMSDKASPPIPVAVNGDYQNFRRYRVRITGADTGAILPHILRDADGHERGNLTYPPKYREHIDLPFPAADKPYGTLSLGYELDGFKVVASWTPEPPPNRQWAFEELRFKGPFLFAEKQFPVMQMEDPLLAEDIGGQVKITTRYFDRKFNEVKSPDAAGGYVAVVKMTGEGGLSGDRVVSLYRLAAPMPRRAPIDFSARDVVLPNFFGLSPGVVSHQNDFVVNMFRHTMMRDSDQNDDVAVILSGLAETAENAEPYRMRNDPWAVKMAYEYQLRKKLGLPAGYRYQEFVPQGYEAAKDKKFPLVIFLHGAGERGSDLKMVGRNGLPAYLTKHPDFPAIVISPLCPRNTWWTPVAVNDLIDEAIAKYRIDPDRIYMTGLSMGGYGTWSYATAYPERLAAIVPICGVGDKNDMARVKEIPTWVFHGDADTVVPIEPDRACVEALKAAGGNVKFTVYPGVGHDSWTRAYNDASLYEWMLAQKKGGK